LKDKNTKIVLTVYDSLLLDFDKNEKHILDNMYQTFDKYGLEVKCKEGINYHDLVDI
jgi:hypothetical protein